MNTYLGIHILNRVWSYLLRDGCRRDEMCLLEGLQGELIDDTIGPLSIADTITLLGDVNCWSNWHEVPEVRP
jgi:hypothetical protein